MKGIEVFVFVLLAVFLIIAGPLVTIWSLNTLFPILSIPYTFWTWLAALIIGAIIKSRVEVKK